MRTSIKHLTSGLGLRVLCAACLLQLLTSCFNADTPRRRTDFTEGWTFHLGDVAQASAPNFDDSSWRVLNLPHDWAIEGEFSADNPSGAGGGALPGGVGWYRKTFTPDAKLEGKNIYIDFDGVYMNAEVFINGTSLGTRPYGYISFRHDLTPHILHGQKNVIAVRVDNSEQPNSRWYSGCGIYRNVWLVSTNPVHIAQWGTYVTTPQVSTEQATVEVELTIDNTLATEVRMEIISVVLDANRVEQARVATTQTLGGGAQCKLPQSITLPKPKLWQLNAPYMYSLLTGIKVDGKLVDHYETPFGVRTFEFNAHKGFFLNGEHVKIKGVCQHHDLGCLGAAINERALQRQLEILKDMGCNAIRTSHNPPAPELLELCDRMGFVVQNETFDMWRKRKTAHDYARYFNEWHERDLTDHILRDRNHPSIFMWSIGNEVLEQWTHADADTLDIQAANLLLNLGRDAANLAQADDKMSVNSLLTKKLADMVRNLDSTRPITAGNNEVHPNNHLFRSEALDIIGFNYHHEQFADVPRNFPGKPFIVTESTSGLMTRGYYRMPSDSMYVWPRSWDVPFHDDSYACSSYDNCHVPWGSTHERNWLEVRKHDFISGMYVWTGFDYIGEPTPYWYPARSSYFGIIDLAGFPKDVYYMYKSEWTDEDVLHLFPHWNHQPGQTIDLWAYYNNADEVELFINNRSQGIRTKGPDDLHVSWRVQYEPGTIRAVSRKDGREVLTQEIHTAGTPAGIRLTPDRRLIWPDGRDLSFVTVEVIDANGNLCPNADDLVKFYVDGSGFIAGVDNGSPVSLESFKAAQRKAFYGKCLVVLQNNGQEGEIKLRATASLESGTAIAETVVVAGL